MEWSDLRYFLAVARTGRLAQAGRSLGVEHTTVARRIAALEASLDARLFDRTAAGWRLTRAGETIIPRAELIEAEVRAVRASTLASTARVAGPLRIATIESWAFGWLLPKLDALQTRYPELQIDVLTGQAQLNLTRGEADVAFRVPKPTQPDLSAMSVAEGSMGLFATAKLADQYRRAIAADQWERVPLAVYTPDYDFLQSAPWFREAITRAKIVMRSSSSLGLMAFALAGRAIVPVPRFVAIAEPRLVSVTDRDLARHRLWCVAHKETRRDPRVAAVFAWAKSELAPVVHESERLR